MFCSLLFSDSYGVFNFPVSTEHSGMGLFTGSADVWSQNALSVSSNPALSSMQKGINLSAMNGKLLFDDYSYSSAYANLAFSGVGLNLPFINPKTNFGSSLETEIDLTSEDPYGEPEKGTLTDSYLTYNFSVNTTSFKNLSSDRFILSSGLTFCQFYEDIDPNESIKHRAYSNNFGLAALYKVKGYDDEYSGKMDLSFAFSANNIFNQKYKRFDNELYLPNYKSFGVGFFSAMPLNPNIGSSRLLSKHCKNAISFKALSSLNYSSDMDEILSIGGELGFLDTFFIRQGYYEFNYPNHPNGSKGRTTGLGLKLNLTKYASLSYNYAFYPISDYFDDQTRWDISANIGFEKFFKN